MDDWRRIQTLVAFLDYLRGAVVRKVQGLPDEIARQVMVPSGTSLLGLVKHLTRVEIAWFQFAFAGIEEALPTNDLSETDDVASVLTAYEVAVARSNEILLGCDRLETRCRRRLVAPEPMTLRWVLVHMIEETGRHAGHADIIREQIDGSTGR